MMMTENLFHRVWTLVSHRRLKNITVILDWVPHTSKLGVATNAELDGAYLLIIIVFQPLYVQPAHFTTSHSAFPLTPSLNCSILFFTWIDTHQLLMEATEVRACPHYSASSERLRC